VHQCNIEYYLPSFYHADLHDATSRKLLAMGSYPHAPKLRPFAEYVVTIEHLVACFP